MAFTNDFNVWDQGVAVVTVAGDPEFGEWDNGVPVVDQDESNPNAQPRRRPAIF